MREEDTFSTLPSERQAQIEVVSSAYKSVIDDLAYLTMPVTAGKRLYELMEKYGVKTKEELEKKRPGALWEEVVLPNIESGRRLAEKIHKEKGRSLVVPGIFVATKLHWSRDEYMVLWMRLISSRAKEIFLAPGWEYASGGVSEFVRGVMIQFRFAVREEPLTIRDEYASEIDMSSGAMLIAHAISHLRERGFHNPRLVQEFQTLASLAYTLSLLSKRDRPLWETFTQGVRSRETWWVLSAAHSLGIKPVSLLPEKLSPFC